MRALCAGHTDRGLVRERNEDCFLLLPLPSGTDPRDTECDVDLEPGRAVVAAVADGMGGVEGGRAASTAAITTLRDTILEHAARLAGAHDGNDWKDILLRAFASGHAEVQQLGTRDRELSGAGTTLSVAAISGRQLEIVHIGDSRILHWRDGAVRQLTVDHTLVRRWIDLGEMTASEAARHEQRHVLVQALGQPEPPEPDRFELELDAGDRLLLCSDGLYEHVRNPEIGAELGSDRPPGEQARALVELAKAGGGEDNITVIVVHID